MSYQKIHIKNLKIGGVDRMPDYRQFFPRPPKRLTIFDIGCHHGFYSLQAVHEGANWSLGIDSSRANIKKAIENANTLNFSRCRFIHGNILSFKTNETFDVVLCINLLQWITDFDKVKTILEKADLYSRKRIIFTIIPCETNVWKLRPNAKGRDKMTLATDLFEKGRFSKYKVGIYKSKVETGRLVIDIDKSWARTKKILNNLRGGI